MPEPMRQEDFDAAVRFAGGEPGALALCRARLAEAEGDLAAAVALLREARFAIPGRPFPAETIDAFLAGLAAGDPDA